MLNFGMTVAKEFDFEEKLKLATLRFQGRYGVMNCIKAVLHQKPVINMKMATTTGSGLHWPAFLNLFLFLSRRTHHSDRFLPADYEYLYHFFQYVQITCIVC